MRLDESSILALAPERLLNQRVSRYGGDGMDVSMRDLTTDDARHVAKLYGALSTLLGELREALGVPAGDGRAPGGFSTGSPDLHYASAESAASARQVLVRTAKDPAWREAMAAARALRGAAPSGADDASRRKMVTQVLHDVRGGALTALALTLDLIGIRSASTADIVRTFYLTRDHLKIMRNALADVDVEARDRDRAYRDHGTRLLFEKWASATHQLAPERSARIDVDSTYEGPVSRRCLEFSALDRVLYNLMNNAVRFTSDGVVTLYLREVGGNLRFVVANTITVNQLDALRAAHGESLGSLYLGGFTTGGEGVGLSICAEFVANAFGLSGAADAILDGHVGATVMDDTFVTWFHWPMGA